MYLKSYQNLNQFKRIYKIQNKNIPLTLLRITITLPLYGEDYTSHSQESFIIQSKAKLWTAPPTCFLEAGSVMLSTFEISTTPFIVFRKSKADDTIMFGIAALESQI